MSNGTFEDRRKKLAGLSDAELRAPRAFVEEALRGA